MNDQKQTVIPEWLSYDITKMDRFELEQHASALRESLKQIIEAVQPIIGGSPQKEVAPVEINREWFDKQLGEFYKDRNICDYP